MKKRIKKAYLGKGKYQKPHLVKLTVDDLSREIVSADEVVCYRYWGLDMVTVGGACCI